MTERVAPRKLNRWHERWDEIENLAAEVNDAIPILLAAAQYVDADAWPSSTTGNEGHSGEAADPVFAALLVALEPARRDAIADHLREIDSVTGEIRGHVKRVARLKDIIVNRRDPRTYDTGGNCKACGRYVSGSATDRLRAMYCSACYRAWLRWREQHDDPVHHLFEKARRRQLDETAAVEAAKGA